MSLLNLLQRDGITPKRAAGTNGGEWASPCPGCGGEDRFRVWPEEERWWCRQCGKSGDMPGYLMAFHGFRYPEACVRLGIEPQGKANSPVQNECPAWIPKEIHTPGDMWRTKAWAFLEYAQKYLWGDHGAEPREWLHGRGLSDETIKAAGLGWNPKDYFRRREAWGLETEISDKAGKPKKLWLPTGLVIPLIDGGHVARLRIRRPDPGDGPRYYLIPGSDARPAVWTGPGPFTVVESELDGWLLYQEAGDLSGVIALGSASYRPDRAAALAMDGEQVILALDFDEAGAKACWGWWKENFPKATRWPVPDGKDPGEAYENGTDLRAWVFGVLAELKMSSISERMAFVGKSEESSGASSNTKDHIFLKRGPYEYSILCPYDGEPRRVLPAVCQWHREEKDPECIGCDPGRRPRVEVNYH